MAAPRTFFINLLLRAVMKRKLSACRTPLDVRGVFESAPTIAPKGVRFTAAMVGGISGEWVEAEKRGAAEGTLLYLHGGGYVAMSPRTHRAITAGFALRGLRVFAADYRLAPEHKYPAAVDDATAAWRGLREQVDGPVYLAGDSAGGGLSLALMLNLRDLGDQGPAGACLFSPWTDLAATGASLKTNRDRDPFLPADGMHVLTAAYASEADLRAPLISPLYGDFTGLPPMLIFVGDTEILLDDSRRVAERIRAARGFVDLRIYHAMSHVWPALNAILPEGRLALDEAAAFLAAAGGISGQRRATSSARALDTRRAVVADK